MVYGPCWAAANAAKATPARTRLDNMLIEDEVKAEDESEELRPWSAQRGNVVRCRSSSAVAVAPLRQNGRTDPGDGCPLGSKDCCGCEML